LVCGIILFKIYLRKQYKVCQTEVPYCFSCCDYANKPLSAIAVNYDKNIPIFLRNLIKQFAEFSGL
jgi:hypothetical protein